MSAEVAAKEETKIELNGKPNEQVRGGENRRGGYGGRGGSRFNGNPRKSEIKV